MEKTFHFLRWSGKKAVAIFCVSIVSAMALIGTTIAFIKMMTDTLTIGFQPATVSVSKSNDGKGVLNDGDVDVYVRVALVFTWESVAEENNIMSSAPVQGVNYNLSVEDGWAKAADGFWYCLNPISAGDVRNAISSVDLIGNAPVGYDLSVEMLVDAIQAEPADAVTHSWTCVTGVDANGNLIVSNLNS